MRVVGSAFALALAVTGCSDQGFTNINDADGDGPAIQVSPPSIDFGDVGSSEDAIVKVFMVESVGNADLSVEDIAIEGDGALSYTILSDELSFNLPVGATKEIEVAFEPMGSSDQYAQALITSNDPINRVVPVDLYGAAAVPELVIDPDPADFGNSYVGCDATIPVDIISVGAEPVTVDTIAHSAGSNAWSVAYDFELPQTLAPGESLTVDVTLAPEDEIPYNGVLEVLSDEPLGSRTGDTTGEGKFAGTYVDNWELDEAKVDLIFAVDQSCSMDDDQASLASNFSYFIAELSNYANDWQVIVANDDNGCNNTGVLKPTTSGYENTFANGVSQGGGIWTEALLTVTSEAVEQTDSGECNYGALREDALVHIVMVSDEAEQSFQSWSTLVDKVVTKKGSESLVRFSAIAGNYPSGCGTADPGTGYYEAVNATGGAFLSICSNWSSNMEALAEASVYKDTYELSHDAVESSIIVRVDGKRRDQGWYWDEATNSVVFEKGSVPDEGSSVEIEYAGKAACD